MTSPGRNAFGSFIVPPAELTLAERCELLADAVPALRFGQLNSYTATYLASALETWLTTGADLEQALGVRPPQGSHNGAARITQQRERDRSMLRLSVALGSDREALRVVRGERPCPSKLLPMLEQLRKYRMPASAAAWTRARQRVSRHGS
jgi:hypothetical protein